MMKIEYIKVFLGATISTMVLIMVFMSINRLSLSSAFNGFQVAPITQSVEGAAPEVLRSLEFDLTIQTLDLDHFSETPFFWGGDEEHLLSGVKSTTLPIETAMIEELATGALRYVLEMSGTYFPQAFVQLRAHPLFFEETGELELFIWPDEASSLTSSPYFIAVIDMVNHTLQSLHQFRFENVQTALSTIEPHPLFLEPEALEVAIQSARQIAGRHFPQATAIELQVGYAGPNRIFYSTDEEMVIENQVHFILSDHRGLYQRGLLGELGVSLETGDFRFFERSKFQEGDHRTTVDDVDARQLTLSWGDQITVIDNSWEGMGRSLSGYFISLDQAVEIGSRYILQEHGSSVDGMHFIMFFWRTHSGSTRWSVSVMAPDGEQLYFYAVDGLTGELIELVTGPFLG